MNNTEKDLLSNQQVKERYLLAMNVVSPHLPAIIEHLQREIKEKLIHCDDEQFKECKIEYNYLNKLLMLIGE